MIFWSAVYINPLSLFFFCLICTPWTQTPNYMLCTTSPQDSYISWSISFLYFIYIAKKKQDVGKASVHGPTMHDGGGYLILENCGTD